LKNPFFLHHNFAVYIIIQSKAGNSVDITFIKSFLPTLFKPGFVFLAFSDITHSEYYPFSSIFLNFLIFFLSTNESSKKVIYLEYYPFSSISFNLKFFSCLQMKAAKK